MQRSSQYKVRFSVRHLAKTRVQSSSRKRLRIRDLAGTTALRVRLYSPAACAAGRPSTAKRVERLSRAELEVPFDDGEQLPEPEPVVSCVILLNLLSLIAARISLRPRKFLLDCRPTFAQRRRTDARPSGLFERRLNAAAGSRLPQEVHFFTGSRGGVAIVATPSFHHDLECFSKKRLIRSASSNIRWHWASPLQSTCVI